MSLKIKPYLPSIFLALTLLMYPFTKIFSLGMFEPFYPAAGLLFIVLVLIDVLKIDNFIIPKVFQYLLTFVLVAVLYNVGYTIFSDYNFLYSGGVYVFLSLFMIALYYYIKSNNERFAKLFFLVTGVCILIYIYYFFLNGVIIGHNSTFMYNINQFAFWSFLSFIILDILIFKESFNKAKKYLQFILFFFVICTLSRSATGGLLVYILATKINYTNWILISILIFGFIILFISHDWLLLNIEFYNIYFKRFVMSREFNDFNNLLYGRGFLSVLENPNYLLIGAAEGNPSRFGHEIWIHNSVLNILFSYGIIGLFIFLKFLTSCFRNVPNAKSVLLSLFVSSLFTETTHNLYIWILLACFLYLKESSDLNLNMSKSFENA